MLVAKNDLDINPVAGEGTLGSQVCKLLSIGIWYNLLDLALELCVDLDTEIYWWHGTAKWTLSLSLEERADAEEAERVIAGQSTRLDHCRVAHVAIRFYHTFGLLILNFFRFVLLYHTLSYLAEWVLVLARDLMLLINGVIKFNLIFFHNFILR